MMITIDPEDVRLSKSEREFLRRIALKLQADAQTGVAGGVLHRRATDGDPWRFDCRAIKAEADSGVGRSSLRQEVCP